MAQRYFPNNNPGTGPVNISKELFGSRTISCINHIVKHLSANAENGEGGLYVGTAGVAYMFYYLVKCGHFPERNQELKQCAMSYLTSALNYYEQRSSSRRSKRVGFLLGNGGVYAVAALIYHQAGDKHNCDKYVQLYQDLAAACEPINFLENGSDELFVGRTGYLMGALLLRRDLGRDVIPSEQMKLLCRQTIESGIQFRQRLNFDGDIPIMYGYHGTLYLGAGHGIAGIIQVLLSCTQFLADDKPSADILKKSVDYLLDYCVQEQNMASNLEGALGSPNRRKLLVHWCHGAAGVVYMFARAYLVFRDQRYLNVCREFGETVWQKGLLKKGPGICHGVAGSGYVFLLLYRLTADPVYLYKAERFGSFIFTEQFMNEARCPDRPYSLFEGWAGTACFLNDLLQPDGAEFPLSDVILS